MTREKETGTPQKPILVNSSTQSMKPDIVNSSSQSTKAILVSVSSQSDICSDGKQAVEESPKSSQNQNSKRNKVSGRCKGCSVVPQHGLHKVAVWYESRAKSFVLYCRDCAYRELPYAQARHKVINFMEVQENYEVT